MFERGLAKPLISILLRRILPDRPSIADAIYRNHQSAVLWHKHTPKGSVLPGSHLLRRDHGNVL